MKKVLMALLVVATVADPSRAAERPNIVLVLADDLGIGDPGCYNRESKIPTPSMDRLAAEGMRFTDMHTPSAVCTPTRYALLTGRYCWRSRLKRGVLFGYDPLLIEPGRLTVASLLRKHGYRTGCVGKWHLGLGSQKPTDYARPLTPGPSSVGFDRFFGIPASLDMDPYLYVVDDRPEKAPTEKIEPSQHRRRGGNGFWRGGAIAPGFRHVEVLPRLTQEAISFLETQADQQPDSPFFLYFPLTAPHTPWVPQDSYRGKSGAGYYGDFVAQVDATLGQVLATLDRLGQAKNTLVIFTSDNGAHWPPQDIERLGHRANAGWRGQKADIWEGGHRVPFLVRWPGVVKPGSVCPDTLCLVDTLASCAAILGERLPGGAGEDSHSFLPQLKGQKAPTRPPVIHHSLNGTFAIRQGAWKLIDGLGSGGFSNPREEKPRPGGPQGQLYNLVDDPAEEKNLYLERPEVVRQLRRLLAEAKAGE